MQVHERGDGTIIAAIGTWFQQEIRVTIVKPSELLPRDGGGIDISALQKVPIEFWVKTGSEDPASLQERICRIELTPIYCEHNTLIGISMWLQGDDRQLNLAFNNYPAFVNTIECDACGSGEELEQERHPDDQPPEE